MSKKFNRIESLVSIIEDTVLCLISDEVSDASLPERMTAHMPSMFLISEMATPFEAIAFSERLYPGFCLLSRCMSSGSGQDAKWIMASYVQALAKCSAKLNAEAARLMAQAAVLERQLWQQGASESSEKKWSEEVSVFLGRLSTDPITRSSPEDAKIIVAAFNRARQNIVSAAHPTGSIGKSPEAKKRVNLMFAAQVERDQMRLEKEGRPLKKLPVLELLAHLPALHQIWYSSDDHEQLKLERSYPYFKRYREVIELFLDHHWEHPERFVAHPPKMLKKFGALYQELMRGGLAIVQGYGALRMGRKAVVGKLSADDLADATRVWMDSSNLLLPALDALDLDTRHVAYYRCLIKRGSTKIMQARALFLGEPGGSGIF